MSDTWAVVVLAAVGVAGVVAIHVWGPADNVGTLQTLVGFLTPTLAALLALRRSGEAHEQASEARTHARKAQTDVQTMHTNLVNGTFARQWAARQTALREGRPEEH